MAQQSPAPVPGAAGGKGSLGGGAIASIVGIVLLVIFLVQNHQDVTVKFLIWSFSMPIWLLIIVAALLGALIWFGLGVMRRHNRRVERRADR